MKGIVSTIRRRSRVGRIALIGGSVGLIFSLVGLAGSPFRASKVARNLSLAEEARRGVLIRQQGVVRQLKEQRVLERVDRLISSLEGAVPKATDGVRLFYFVQLVSSALDIELKTITTGEPEALGLPIAEEDIAQRRVNLGGRARLLDLVDLVEAMRVAGLPVAIQEVRASLDSTQDIAASVEDQAFQFTMTLCVFERVRVSATDETAMGVPAPSR